MARMIGQTKSWLWWLAGFLCALAFGRGARAGEMAKPLYGVPEPTRPPAVQPSEDQAGRAAAGLENSEEWKQISSAWAEAEKLLATKWDGRNPVNRDQEPKKGALAGIETARRNVEALLVAGQLSAGEAEVLKQGLGILAGRVTAWAAFQPMCYAPPPPPPPPKKFDFERGAAKRLAARLPLLEKLAAQKKLQPAVVGKTLQQFNSLLSEAEPAVLKDENLQGMPEDEKAGIIRTRDAAKAAAAKIQALLAEAEAKRR